MATRPAVYRTPPPSEGARLLRALLRADKRTQAEIAKDVGFSAPAISTWASGARCPTGAAALELERAFGIAAASWREAPAAPRAESAPAVPAPAGLLANLTAGNAPDSSSRDDTPPEPDVDRPGGARAAALAHLQRVRTWRAQTDRIASVAERVKVHELERRAIVEFGRFSGELGFDESRLADSPKFRVTMRAVLEAIAAWPEALDAVTRKMTELGL